jgi:hypothetical protein
VAVFANDGSLLAEFECPHVKVKKQGDFVRMNQGYFVCNFFTWCRQVSRCCGLKITSEGYVVTLAKVQAEQ